MSKRANTILFFVLTLLAILGIVKYCLEYIYATKGYEYADLQDQVQQLKIDNQRLRNEILNEMSLHVIATKAASMGFTQEQKPLILY